MALNKQIHIYSIDTSAFYNKNERELHDKINSFRAYKKDLLKKRNKYSKKYKEKYNDSNKEWERGIKRKISLINKRIKDEKSNLLLILNLNKGIRTLNKKSLTNKKVISVFESTLSRTLGLKANTLSEDLIIVQTYFFDVLESLILNGFVWGKDIYIPLTASAGQIRTKKTVFIKKNRLDEIENTITCGLSIKKINELGGVNINKYLAYLALSNSATDLWEDFNIEKTIVVDDFETMVQAEVDFIDDKTYEIKRQVMDIPINHTDGCGMMLPVKFNKTMMCRVPWIKGLLVPMAFDEFIREKTEESGVYCGVIKDIYGKEHDILKEKIEVIFTKSQFKMWKYYKNWEEYINNYKRYKCEAGKCNEEEDKVKNAKINYQMLQTLTDINKDELEIICEKTKTNIQNVGSNKDTMLNILGVTRQNKNKNYLQEALEIYPELLDDTYSKQILKQVKKSMVKDARAGKLSIEGKYAFICPDLYAFCECLFLRLKNPEGLLKNEEVYCNLYRNIEELDCLRSPHLYREHAVRNNVIDENKEKWFITKCLYTSCHDVISKILQFDVDGDKSLVCAEKTIVDVAKRNMQGILPLYYNMRKAGEVPVTSESIYNGLKAAYTGGNIGEISNNITKIWNSKNVNLEVIKILCMENNFTIDYAKTLYKPKRPGEKKDMIVDYTKLKVPHFFIYAKDKEKDKVENSNNSVVNRIGKIIKNPPIKFQAIDLGKFNYKMLMNNKDLKIDKSNDIIKKYTELDLKSHFMINNNDSSDRIGNILYIYQDIREQLLKINKDKKHVTDVLVKFLYETKKSSFKTTLWQCFGDVIVDNLKNNLTKKFKSSAKHCDKCGILIEAKSNRTMYCENCYKIQRREYKAIKEKERRERGQLEKHNQN